ncbi:MAG TPA: ankyrin repeat domain-containing protein [Thermoanaerobaculia bacterium]|nr:ankyrin repeat domain-containing protein [Thermoanaerobaculia bacterium]
MRSCAFPGRRVGDFFEAAAGWVRGYELIAAVVGLAIAAWGWNRTTMASLMRVWIVAALLAVPFSVWVGLHLRSFILPKGGGAGSENYLGDISPLATPFIAFALAIPLAAPFLILVTRIFKRGMVGIGDPISAMALSMCVVAVAANFSWPPIKPKLEPHPAPPAPKSVHTTATESRGVSPSDPPFVQAIGRGDIVAARRLLSSGVLDSDGSGLLFASELAEPDFMRFCLLAKAPVDARDLVGRTPLILVVTANPRGQGFAARQKSGVDVLIDAGANVNLADNAGHAALQEAQDRHLEDIAARLIAAGAIAQPGGQPKFRPPNK